MMKTSTEEQNKAIKATRATADLKSSVNKYGPYCTYLFYGASIEYKALYDSK